MNIVSVFKMWLIIAGIFAVVSTAIGIIVLVTNVFGDVAGIGTMFFLLTIPIAWLFAWMKDS